MEMVYTFPSTHRSFHLVALMLAIVRYRQSVFLGVLLPWLLSSGCCSLTSSPSWTTWRRDPEGTITDSVNRPDSSETSRQNLPDRQDSEENPSGAEQTIRQRPVRPSLPVPESNVPAKGRLLLEVSAPETVTVGERVVFAISVTNQTTADVSDVDLICEYDASFAFPGRTDRTMQQSLDVLKTGETRSLSIALDVHAEGNPCARFFLKAGGEEHSRQSVCVRSVVRDVDVQFDGPDLRFVGTRAEFLLTVKNRSGRPLDETQVTLRFPQSLAAREASAGAIRLPGELQWKLGTLRIAERVQIQAEFDCLTEEERACVQAIVVYGQHKAADDVCLKIEKPTDKLVVSMDDLKDPIEVEEQVVLRLRLTNRADHSIQLGTCALQPSRHLSIHEVTLAESLRGESLSWEQLGRDVRVRGMPEIAPQQSLTLRVLLRGEQVGRGEVKFVYRPTLSSDETMTLSESTYINPRKIGPDVTTVEQTAQ